MSQPYTVRHGGLMRCCLATLEEEMRAAKDAPKEGDTMQCRYHDGEGMIFKDGGWEWNAQKTPWKTP